MTQEDDQMILDQTFLLPNLCSGGSRIFERGVPVRD